MLVGTSPATGYTSQEKRSALIKNYTQLHKPRKRYIKLLDAERLTMFDPGLCL